MRKVFVIIGVIAVVLCAVGGYFVYNAVVIGDKINDSSITREQFDAQRIGGEEAAVRDALPAPLDTDEADLYGSDPARQGKPAGSTCAYYVIKPISEGAGPPVKPMFRFCFAGGKLAEKKQIQVAG
jgi:hypothetical protein